MSLTEDLHTHGFGCFLNRMCRLSTAIVIALLAQVIVFGAQPWDVPFTPDSAAVMKAAASVTASDASAILLLDEHHYEIDAEGRTTSKLRRVYRIISATALEEWASVEREWEPWHEGKPELRARVISPDGVVHWLDAKTIADAAASQLDVTIFTDTRVVRAPLPALSAGAVAEYEITQKETLPLFSAGVVHEFSINADVPVERFHASIDAAPNIPLHAISSLLPASAITRSESRRGTHLELDVGRTEPPRDIEFSIPLGEPQVPSFRFSTGTSWQKIASAYDEIVQQKLAKVDRKLLLESFGAVDLRRAKSSRETAAILTRLLHERVRYTGVEFGQAAIVPTDPREVISRHYGDCKDKATLLVALLRAAGLDAHVALLRAGESTDIDPKLPGFGMFNHAIVFVADKEFLWIDPTVEYARLGVLPVEDQGRHALVISSATSDLTNTPESTASDNRVIRNVDVRLSNSGKGTVRESLEAYGGFELAMRSTYSGDDRETRTAVERLAKNSFGAGSLGDFSCTKKGDFSQPFRLVLEARESTAAITGLQDAVVRLSNSFLFENLPYALLSGVVQSAADQKTRKHDFVLQTPYQSELHFKIYPPSGFSSSQLPAPENSNTVGMVYSSSSSRDNDGAIHLDYRFDISQRRLTPSELQGIQAEIRRRFIATGQLITFNHKAADLVALGKTAEALRLAEQEARERPESALSQMRLAQLLMNSGAGQPARAVAKKAVELDPKSDRAWLTLAYAYERDSFGRFRTGDWNPAEAEKALRKAIALSGSNIEAQMELAILLEYDAAGERYAKGARISDAVTVYRDILKKAPNPVVSQNLTLALMHLGRYQEAEDESRKLTEQSIYPVISIVLTALREGTDQAILGTQNGTGGGPARAANLSGAAATLTQLREYKAGVELLRAAQRLDGDPKLTQMLGLFEKMQRHETAFSADGDPRSPVQRFLVLAALGSSSPSQLAALLSKDADLITWRARLERTRKSLGLFRMGMRSNGIPSASVADLILGQTKLEINDLSESGSPAEPARAASPPGSSKVIQRWVSRGGSGRVAVVTVTSHVNLGVLMFFITRENGVCKLLGTGDGLESVGRVALEALAKHDLTTAQEWLDAIKNYALPVSSRDDKGPAIRYLWAGTAPETRNSTFARAAAASLEGTYNGSPEATKTLQEIASHPPPYMQQEDLNFAICEALNKAHSWQELRNRSRVLLRSKYYREAAVRFLGNALIGLREWSDLAKAADERLAVSAADHSALQLAAIAAMARADYVGAARYLTRSKNAPYGALFSDKLLTAWNGILAGKVPDEVLGELETDNIYALANEGSTYAYTLALAQLRNGKTEPSARSLAIGLEMDTTVPSDLAWLVERELMKAYQLDGAAMVASEHPQQQGRSDAFELPTVLFSE